MDNKLSELSKPVAWKFKNADGGDRVSLERKANIYGRHDFQPLYSQEYVSALLTELKASKKSNAFLKEQLAKLANFNPDWDMLEVCRESWREVAAALKEAEARLAAKDKRIADDEEYIEKLESAWERINELEINEKQMLRDHYCAEDVLARQRNDYESALEGMYEAVTGKRPAWGCGFGADEAVKEVTQIHAELEVLLDRNIKRAKKLGELLDTPVQLQNCDFESVAIMAHWCTDEQLKAWVKGVEHAKKQIRAAGFKVEGDD